MRPRLVGVWHRLSVPVLTSLATEDGEELEAISATT
jgi:hypothetical protein